MLVPIEFKPETQWVIKEGYAGTKAVDYTRKSRGQILGWSFGSTDVFTLQHVRYGVVTMVDEKGRTRQIDYVTFEQLFRPYTPAYRVILAGDVFDTNEGVHQRVIGLCNGAEIDSAVQFQVITLVDRAGNYTSLTAAELLHLVDTGEWKLVFPA